MDEATSERPTCHLGQHDVLICPYTTWADREIERLRADKAAISQTASDYLHEIERLRASLFRLSEDIAFTPMHSTDMDELKARLKFARDAIALPQAREILGT